MHVLIVYFVDAFSILKCRQDFGYLLKDIQLIRRSYLPGRTTLARWRAAQDGGVQTKARRPFLASECDDLREAEKWRNQVISEVARKVSQIQNGKP